MKVIFGTKISKFANRRNGGKLGLLFVGLHEFGHISARATAVNSEKHVKENRANIFANSFFTAPMKTNSNLIIKGVKKNEGN